MNVKEIVRDYLTSNNYDGLTDPDNECGCDLEDFMPCNDCNYSCIPAHKQLIYVEGVGRDYVMMPAKEYWK